MERNTVARIILFRHPVSFPIMKTYIILAAAAACLAACDARVNSAPAGKDTTTIITPAGKEEKKVENNTTIVNPPAAEQKKVETNTTIIAPQAAPAAPAK